MDRLERHLLRPIAQINRIKLVKYLGLSIVVGLLVSILFGESFDYSQVKLKGPSKSLSRNVRSAAAGSGGASSTELKEPFPDRPRIRTRNGHLWIEASQNKNIEFRTSGSQGAVSINGIKLDKLLNVTRALEKTALPGRLLSSSDDYEAGNQLEFALRGIFTADQRLKRLETIVTNLTATIDYLLTRVNNLSKSSAKQKKLSERIEDFHHHLISNLKQNECLNNETGASVCQNGATCLDMYNDYKCLCTSEWEGVNCDKDVDECAKFRGTDLGCQNGGYCVNKPGGYSCLCKPNFHGIHCTEQHDDCALSSSKSLCGHGKCIDLVRTTPNQARYECACDQGWTNDERVSPACIIDIDECNPQASNGTLPNAIYPCSTQPFVQCTNLPGSFQCSACPAGYQGNGRVCTDIDECLVDNGGCSKSPLVECINLIGSRRCGRCPPGYSGDGISCTLSTACSAGPEPNGGCHPMAKCIPLQGFAADTQSRLCDCQYPYTGSGIGPMGCVPMSVVAPNSLAAGPTPGLFGANNSDFARGGLFIGGVSSLPLPPSDPCAPNPLPPCQNGATCRVVQFGEVECLCPLGWSGSTCAEAIGRCSAKYATLTGQLQFPPANADFKDLAKVPAGYAAATSGNNNLLYNCLWTITLVEHNGLKSSVNNLNIYLSRIQNKLNPLKKVELFMANSTGFNEKLANCVEYLDVFEITHTNEVVSQQQQQSYQPSKLVAQSGDQLSDMLAWLNASRSLQSWADQEQSSGKKGFQLVRRRRLLARICTELGSSSQQTSSLRHQSLDLANNKLQFQIETGEAELEYSVVATTRSASQVASEPKLTFELEWNASEPNCGGELELAESGSISSPKFPEFYRAGIECRWIIRVPQGKRIRLQVGDLSLLAARESMDKVCSDSLTILDGKFGPQRPVLFNYCGNNITANSESPNTRPIGRSVVSSSSVVEVLLDSSPDSDWPVGARNMRQKRGFIIMFASEPDSPDCGGLYTARSGTIVSSDYESNQPIQPPMAMSPPEKPANQSGGGLLLSGLRLLRQYYGTSFRLHDNKVKTMRCEYELRPAEHRKYQRVSIDKVELPSAMSSGMNSMQDPLRLSRRFSCLRGRLTIYDVAAAAAAASEITQPRSAPIAAQSVIPTQNRMSGDGAGASKNKSTLGENSAQPSELAKFCSGDDYDVKDLMAGSSPVHEHLLSTGHSLVVVYEASWWERQQQQVAADSIDQQQAGDSHPIMPAGFRLRYSTVCTSAFENLAGQVEMELGLDNPYCLYHFILPPNNSISVIVQPQMKAKNQQISSPSSGWLDADQECQYEAFLIDGPLENAHKSLHQLERKIAQFMATQGGGSQVPPPAIEQRSRSSVVAAGRPSGGDLDFDGDLVWLSSVTRAAATTASATPPSTTNASARFLKFARDPELNIKQFDPCHANTFDSIWNHASLLVRRKRYVRSVEVGAIASIKYQAEPSCGGILSDSKSGSFKLVASQKVEALTRPPLTATRYSLLYERQFRSKCAWIIRAPQGSLVQFSFKAPDDAIRARISEWQAWAKQQLELPVKNQSTTTNSSSTIINDGSLLDNCRDIFPEFLELYEPQLDRVRILCLAELLPSNSTIWTSASNTVYVRLLNFTDTHNSSWVKFKPLLGGNNELIGSYKVVAQNESKSYGGVTLFDSGVIRSPRFPYNYPAGLDISWVIQVRFGQQIRLNFSSFKLEPSGDCIFDFLELRNGLEKDSPLIGRFCGNQLQNRILVTQTNLLRLRFVTDRHTSSQGFELFYDGASSGCGGELETASGQVDSPYYPQPYAHSARCEWNVEVNPGNRIEVTIVDLQLDTDSACNNSAGTGHPLRAGFVELFDSDTWNGPATRSLGRLCRLNQLSEKTKKFVTRGNKFTIVYQSQALDQSRGFRIQYRTICEGLELNSPSGSIESPGFPRGYEPNATCGWYLRAPLGSRLRLALTHVEIEHPTLIDSMTSKTFTESSQTTKPASGRDPNITPICYDDELAIWSLNASSPDKPDELKLINKVQAYSNVVVAARFGAMRSNEIQYLMNNNNNRTSKTLRMSPQNGTLIASICGQATPTMGTSDDKWSSPQKLLYELDTNRAYVTFHSDNSIQASGFRLEWQVLGCGAELSLDDESTSESIVYHEQKLTRRQQQSNRSPAYECFWTVRSTGRISGQQTELLVFSDMHQIGQSQESDLCKESSLTIYDGPTMSSPILMQNCDSKRPPQYLFTSDDSTLIRFYSSGKRYSGHEFRIMAHPGYGTKCIHQDLSPAKARKDKPEFNVFSHTISWPPITGSSNNNNNPNNGDQFASCSDFHLNSNYGRIMFRIEELNVPYEPVNASLSPIDTPTNRLIDSKICKGSKNYVMIGRSDSRDEYLCGRVSRQEDDLSLIANSGNIRDDKSRSVFVLERSYSLVNFKARASLGASWKVSIGQLCGSTTPIRTTRDFSTPNYPDKPVWARSENEDQTGSPRDMSENVCLWRFEPDPRRPASDATSAGSSDSGGAKDKRIFFQLINFVASGTANDRDCLRVYEGIDLNMRQTLFNLTDLDRNYTPKLRICSQYDINHRTLSYASRGQAIFVLVSGNATAKFRVHPFDHYCGGEFHLDKGEFSSPNYPDSMPNTDLDCFYHLKGAPGSKFALKLWDLHLPEPLSPSAKNSTADCDDVSHIEIYKLDQMQKKVLDRPRSSGLMIGLNHNTLSESKRLGNSTSTTSSSRSSRSLNRLNELAYLYTRYMRSTSGGLSFTLSNTLNLFDYHSAKLIGKFCGSSSLTRRQFSIDGDVLIRYRHFKETVWPPRRPANYGLPYVMGTATDFNYGFLASYSIEYERSFELSPTENSVGILGSPQFPMKQKLNATLMYTFRSSDPESVLQFELISLTLPEVPGSSTCSDSLNIFDGPNPTKDIRLSKFCGNLMFKVMTLPSAASPATFIARASDPIIEKNLVRLVRTSSNMASIVYDNHQVAGQFLLRFRAVKKSEPAAPIVVAASKLDPKTNKTTTISSDPNSVEDDLLLADDALEQQGFMMLTNNSLSINSTSKVSSLCSRTIELTSLTSNGTLREVNLASPNWPSEPGRTTECHWLVMTHESKTIRFQADLIDFGGSGGGASGDHPAVDSPGYCLEQAFATTKRAYLIIHDGASTISPELARYCLPMVPAHLQSTGRYMLIRYVFQPAPTASPLNNQQVDDVAAQGGNAASPPSPSFVETRPRRFKGRVSLNPCGGHFHVTNMLLLDDLETFGGPKKGSMNYENNLDCSYFLFAKSLDESLSLHWQRFELAAQPSNRDCTTGDYLEIRLLNFNARPISSSSNNNNNIERMNENGVLLESLGYTVGRSLGRFCAANPPQMKSPDSYGPGVVLQFHSDSTNNARGWSLVAVSLDSNEACTKHMDLDPQRTPYARFSSPTWPHGFYGDRDCLYLFTTQPNKTIEITFLKLQRSRAPDWISESRSDPSECKDSMAYLDDNEASPGLLTWLQGLFETNETRTKSRYLRKMRTLVREIPCNLALPNGDSRIGSSYNLATVPNVNLEDLAQNWNMTSLVQPIEMDQFIELKRLFNPSKQMTFSSNSSAFLLNYRASNLLAGHGFLALARVSDKQPFKCGGKVTATDNSMISAQFNVVANDSGVASIAYEQCLWDLPSASGWSAMESNYINLLYDRFEEQPVNNNGSEFVNVHRTSYIVFDVLEIPPAIEGACVFEPLGFGALDKSISARMDKTCGLSRLIMRSRLELPVEACGNLTANKQTRWLPIKTLDTELMLRTKNLVNAKTGDFYRGMRAFYHESMCRGPERVAGDGIRIHSSLADNSSYVPSICWWRVDLNSDNFKIWFTKINLRKPAKLVDEASQEKKKDSNGTASVSNDDISAISLCDPDKYPDLDYIELRAYESFSSAILQRFCYFNQQNSRMKPIVLPNSDRTLYIQFVAGFPRLANNLKSFADKQQNQNYEFDLLITALSNQDDFCKLNLDFNFNSMIVHQENPSDNVWLGHDLMSIKVYPRKVHCTQYISLIGTDSRVNMSFYGIFDLEQSLFCANDYLLVENVFDETLNTATTIAGALDTSQAKNPTVIGRWCGRKRPEGFFVSSSNKVKITFHSNESIEGRGFRLLWSEIRAKNTSNENEELTKVRLEPVLSMM